MARSSSTPPAKSESATGAQCEFCGARMKRNNDLPRHMVLHAKNKEEFMYSCPVEGCTHQTLQKSNLATHIRTHTRAKPHKCPEYFPNGQKCDFATADPSSLHRHRKRKHGYKPRSLTATSSMPTASGSGTREASVSSSTSFESEESFGLRPESSDADPSPAQESTSNSLSYSIHAPYSPSNKASANPYDTPYYPPLDLKVPDWIGSPVHFPSASTYWNDFSSAEFPLSMSANDTALFECWPELVSPDYNGVGATRDWSCEKPDEAFVHTSTSSHSAFATSPPRFHQDLATSSPDACASASYAPSAEPFQYLFLPSDLFPVRSV
ncbi:hypothetical protein B0H17DRAFT_1194879 [Mycena rosella]|uniref:C2H2-type domain-containing protein n=1 Tax=Mycena rosella TaxID=1033263 RepID=A0AAD7E0D1_MYCRO|nr:hypothetical protein B0H17DRAFT_1194879 [Mycena rosella]